MATPEARTQTRPAAGAGSAAAGGTAAAILAAFLSALATAAAAVIAALRAALSSRYPDLPQEQVDEVVADEQRMLDLYRENAQARVAAALRTVLALPSRDAELKQAQEELELERARPQPEVSRLRTLELRIEALRTGPGARERAVRGVLQREEQYARQQAREAMARGVAAADRARLHVESPWGAYWQLDPFVREHTVGCLIMGGKAWPWVVLDRVHPPRHGGCPCRLRSIGWATGEGLLRGLPSVENAIRAASGVLMEDDAQALGALLALADRGESGAVRLLESWNEAAHPRDREGRWREGGPGGAIARALGGRWEGDPARTATLRLPDNNVKIKVGEGQQAVTLYDIIVERKGGGVGMKVIRALVDYADRTDQRLFLDDIKNRPFIDRIRREIPGFELSGPEAWREMPSRRGGLLEYDPSQKREPAGQPSGGRFAAGGAQAARAEEKPHKKHPMKLGVSDNHALLDPALRPQAIAMMKKLGAREARLVLTWGETRTADGFDFSRFEAAVDELRGSGIRVRLTITGTPEYDKTGDQALSKDNASPTRFAGFVAAVAKRFRGRIASYSMWNEPNHPSFLSPPDPKRYKKLFIAGQRAAKKADPGAPVLFGELAPGPMEWITAAAGGVKADGIAIHPYEMFSPSKTKLNLSNLPRIQKQLHRLAKGGKLSTGHGHSLPVYVTEFGFFAATPEAERAKLLRKAYATARRNGVRSLMLYQLFETPGAPWNTGIIPEGGEPGAAFQAVALLREEEQLELLLEDAAWDPSLHPRDRFGRFIDAVAALTPRGQPGPTHARLPDGTRVTRDPDGTFRVVRNGRIVRGQTALEAAYDAVDRSARSTNDPRAIGGQTRYRNFEDWQYNARIGGEVSPPTTIDNPSLASPTPEEEYRARRARDQADSDARNQALDRAEAGIDRALGRGSNPVAVGQSPIEAYRRQVAAVVGQGIEDVGTGPVTEVHVIDEQFLAFRTPGRIYTVNLDAIAVRNNQLQGIDRDAIRAWTGSTPHSAPRLTNKLRENAGLSLLEKRGTHVVSASGIVDPSVYVGVPLRGAERAHLDNPPTRAVSPEPVAAVIQAGQPGHAAWRVENTRRILRDNVLAVPDPQRRAAAEVVTQLHGFEHGGLTVFIGAVGRYGYSGNILTDTGSVVGRFSREFVEGSDGTIAEVYHSSFSIDEAYRHRGAGTPITERMFDAYRNAGVPRVRVSAGLSSGGYMWAKMGFGFRTAGDRSTYPRSWARSQLPAVRRAAQENGVPEALVDEFERALQDGHLDEPWKIARFGSRTTWQENTYVPHSTITMWLGKKLLIGTSWEGVKKL